MPEFDDLGAAFYAVSVDTPKQSRAMKEEMGLNFDLLCDPKREWIKSWNLLNPFEAGGVATPATVVLDKQGVVRFLGIEKLIKRTSGKELLDFLNTRLLDDAHQGLGSADKLSLVDASAVLQMGRNLVLRGSWPNWKHFLALPLELGRAAHGSVFGPQRVFLTRDFDAPPEKVFPYLADPDLMSSFLDAKLERISDSPSDKDNPNGVGSVRKVKIGPSSLEETITRLEPPHLCQYVISKGSPLKNYTGTILVTGNGKGSRVVWTMNFQSKMPYAGRLVAGAMWAGFSKGLKSLEKRL